MSERLGQVGKERLGLVVVVVVTAISLLVFGGVLPSAFRAGGETVRAQFSEPGRLNVGDPVRVAGVQVGRVAGMTLDPGGRSATVELEVSDEALPVYEDARAVIRTRTVLGGSLAVDLDRGSPGSPALGNGVIPVSRTDGQVEVDDLLTTFRERQIAGLRTLLAEIPGAFEDPAQPARVLSDLAETSPTATAAVRALRGVHVGDLPDLVSSADRAVRALDGPDEPLRAVVEGAAATLRTTARREADIRAALTRGARVLPQARSTLARLDTTLERADPLIAELQDPARRIAPAVDRLRPVLVDTDRLLARTRPLLTALRPAVTSLARAAVSASPLLVAIQPGITRLDRAILPRLAEPDPISQRPGYQMIGPTFAGLTSVASRFDEGGHLLRLSAQGGERPIQTLPCTTYLTDPTREDVVSCELLSQAFADLLGGAP